jgi:membrane complex biogenesis BtpA family protein
MKEDLLRVFKNYPAVAGYVHLPALPGTPGWKGDMEEVKRFAVKDAVSLAEGGVDGVVVENFWDAPFSKGSVEPVTIAAMTACISEIRKAVDVAVGINVLRNDGVAALSIAAVTGAQFIRVSNLTHAMVTDQGIIEGCSYEVSRLKARLGADVLIFADVMVKHAFPLGVMDIGGAARDIALRGGADVLVVSGSETGAPIDVSELRRVREAVPGFPVASGSGVNEGNAGELKELLEVILIGTWFKRDGDISKPVDTDRVKRMIDLLR